MSGPLILVVTAIYFLIGLDLAIKGNLWGGVVWFGYCLANIGLWKTFQ
jgi:mannose/fructose/N-acetylgalactosamine-specific phosphotransferase system component IID